MIILTKVSVGEGEEGFELAVINITDELRKTIVEARELFQMVRSKNPELSSLVLWNGAPYFYKEEGTLFCEESGEDKLTDVERYIFETEEYLILTEKTRNQLFDDAPEEAGPARTCIDQLIIGETGFYWRSTPKHSDGVAETRTILYRTLFG